MRTFDELLERWQPAPDKRIHMVGFFRSNTREVLQLSPEDLHILETRFPGPAAVCLQVKPYATRVSEATFFLRENNSFPTTSQPPAFPFRRREMGGGAPSRRPRGAENQEAEPASDTTLDNAAVQGALAGYDAATANALPGFALSPASADGESTPSPVVPPAKPRTGWFWLPLSFIFLLLGVVMGFQIALTYRNQQPLNPSADPDFLDLTVVQFGESLHLKWNTEALVFRTAKRGVLHIQDGAGYKEVELQQDDLTRGGALYRNSTSNVKFQLEVFPRDRNSVSETVELRLLEPAK